MVNVPMSSAPPHQAPPGGLGVGVGVGFGAGVAAPHPSEQPKAPQPQPHHHHHQQPHHQQMAPGQAPAPGQNWQSWARSEKQGAAALDPSKRVAGAGPGSPASPQGGMNLWNYRVPEAGNNANSKSIWQNVYNNGQQQQSTWAAGQHQQQPAGAEANANSPLPPTYAGAAASGLQSGPQMSGWKEFAVPETGEKYYLNVRTGKTQWERPTTPAE